VTTREYILELTKKKIERLEAENEQLRAELEHMRKSIKSAKAHLETQSTYALGRDPQSGHSYLLEMIYSFEKLLEKRP
jgi:hypothetical protein